MINLPASDSENEDVTDGCRGRNHRLDPPPPPVSTPKLEMLNPFMSTNHKKSASKPSFSQTALKSFFLQFLEVVVLLSWILFQGYNDLC